MHVQESEVRDPMGVYTRSMLLICRIISIKMEQKRLKGTKRTMTLFYTVHGETCFAIIQVLKICCPGLSPLYLDMHLELA